ncbi:MAG: protein kinase [Deltaproteobacteria bacterium]|nr:protein kinase [Deltaproteobacteria bacterium]
MRPDAEIAASPALEDTAQAPVPAPLAEVPEHTLTAPSKMPARSAGEGLATGMRLGHFQIEKKLGAGGMGEVYLATDLALDRPVAIKVLPPGTTSGIARERLIREARAQARVNHPNVAHIYFIGEQDGRLYFAMEFVGGKTLADRVASGPLPVEEALALIRGAALGLREAQRSGFLHRDVKPSNLMVDAHAAVKVLDFGLVAGDAEAVLSGGAVDQTTMAGTPLYMAPEQARGERIDLRADIYALGATLYHLVSGRPPFRADSPAELVTLHASAARPAVPRGANPRTAIAAIDALIARMMAPLPADRFSTYDELLHAVEVASAEHTRPAGFWARWMAAGFDLLVVAVTMLLIAVAIALLAESRSSETAEGIAGILAFPILATYHAIATRRWGTSIGKSLFELEVVTIDTGTRPSWKVSIRRALTLFALPIIGSMLSVLGYLYPVFEELGDILTAACIPLLALLLLHASLRTPGKRAPWDRSAGTIVRYRGRQR